MKRYVTVRVVDHSGRPRRGVRVGCFIHRILADGFKPDQYTDNEGAVEFTLDDESRITLYVNGQEIRPTQRTPAAVIKLVV